MAPPQGGAPRSGERVGLRYAQLSDYNTLFPNLDCTKNRFDHKYTKNCGQSPDSCIERLVCLYHSKIGSTAHHVVSVSFHNADLHPAPLQVLRLRNRNPERIHLRYAAFGILQGNDAENHTTTYAPTASFSSGENEPALAFHYDFAQTLFRYAP